MSTYLRCPICGGTERSLLPESVCEECGCGMKPVTDAQVALNKDAPRDDRIAALRRLAATPAPAVGREGLDWMALDWEPGWRFRVRDEPGEHDPCYLILPGSGSGGPAIPFVHHGRNGVDQARARFIADACNSELARRDPLSAEAREVMRQYEYGRMPLDQLTALRAALAARNEQAAEGAVDLLDVFCDANCTWANHHPDCARAARDSHTDKGSEG